MARCSRPYGGIVHSLLMPTAAACSPSSRPRDLLNLALQVAGGRPDIDHGCVERVVAHDLGHAVQRDGLGHAIPEPMAQIVGAHIGEARTSHTVGRCSRRRAVRATPVFFDGNRQAAAGVSAGRYSCSACRAVAFSGTSRGFIGTC